ncbi:MAG TPA: MgtC/SapB family protein, partial [Actinomycetota bacterium]|nr:MgtC/SapB family protein [Actinomycetota bacterium]
MISQGEIVVRLLIAAAFGALLGLERERKDQPAGLRTFILVAVGSCLFALVSAFGFDDFTGESSDQAVRADVTRISSQIVVGIGFLGGGTILRYGGMVRGLTTAAGLWVTAAVGLAVAMGFWVGASAAVLLTLISLVIKPLEKRLRRAS